MMRGKTLGERWKKLSSMSQVEWFDRLRQEFSLRIDTLRYRTGCGFGVGLKPLSASQRPRFFFSSREVPALCSLLKQRLPQQAAEIVRGAEKICQHRLDLLGYDDLEYGAEIDWHCDRVHSKRAPIKPAHTIRYLDFDEVGDAKITWELNRHQHLVTLAKAYRLTDDERFAAELLRQWRHWHVQNPYPMGINWTSSLEVGMRALSWIWIYFLLENCAVLPAGFHQEWLYSLGIAGRHLERHLSTYFSPNTHLLGEAVALFFIGVLCPELDGAERWKQNGCQLVQEEARRQVRTDGLHFEQSTHYHVYALDFFLHAAILSAANDVSTPPEFDRAIEQMVSALSLLCRAGSPPRFGDDDGGRLFDPGRNRSEHMFDPLATGAVLFGRGDFKFLAGDLREETLWLLGPQGVAEFDRITPSVPGTHSLSMEASGLYLMSDASSREQIVIQCGSPGGATAGHAHADALSVCWNRNGRPLLIDPGTCEYVGPGSERREFRATAAHNTLTVDGLDQAEQKGAFGWSRLPKVRAEGWVNGQLFDLFVGSHDGYTRLPQPVLHRRWVFWLKSRFWLVRDVVLGEGTHRLDIHWHMNPEIPPQGEKLRALEAGERWGMRLVEVQENGWAHEVRDGWWSPAYGRKERAPVLQFSTSAELPAEFVSLLEPVEASGRPVGRLLRLQPLSEQVKGYRYRVGEEDHSMFFTGKATEWTLGPWTTDAEFLYWGRSGEGHALICCNVRQVKSGAKTVLTAANPVLRCEILVREGRVQVVSSAPDVKVDEGAIRELAAESGLAAAGKPAALDMAGL